MAWLSRLAPGTSFFPQIVLPMSLLGIGIGSALVPLTTAGIEGVRDEDAGAASGLVNVAQQLGGSLGLGILITVFAAAGHPGAVARGAVGSVRTSAQVDLAHAVATALKGSAVFLALALVVVVAVMRPAARDEVVTSVEAELEELVVLD
jgi:hypothetical protein